MARVHAVTGVYATALTTATITLTFLALEEGLELGPVALLTALSALTQVLVRLPLGLVLSRIPDRTLVISAVATLALSLGAALALPGVGGLALAQVLLGASRAVFWTAGQTQVIRLSPNAARGMSHNMLITGLGNAIGPVLAGSAAHTAAEAGAWVALGLSGACIALSFTLTRLPVFNPPERPDAGRVGFRFGVLMASSGSFASGIWHVSMTALAPAILADARWTELAIGAVLGLTNAVFLVGVLLSGRASARAFALVVVVGSALVAIGVGCLALAGAVPAVAVAALLASGAGAGALMTLAPALASDAVHPEERGQAVVVTGTYRAGALLGGPLLVWGAGLALPFGPVMLALGALAGLPAIVMWLLRPRTPPVSDGRA